MYKCYGWDSNFEIEDCFALNYTLISIKLISQMRETHWEFKKWLYFDVKIVLPRDVNVCEDKLLNSFYFFVERWRVVILTDKELLY